VESGTKELEALQFYAQLENLIKKWSLAAAALVFEALREAFPKEK